MNLLFRLLLISCAAALAVAAASVQAAETPNIVILYADDMGYGDLAIQNPEAKIPTPNLDRLARGGLRFTDAHSSSGICTPSRYALLTGRYHWRKFHDIVNAFGASVFDDELTLAEMLRERGYAAACIGKWHLGWDWAAIRREGATPKPIPGDRRNRKAYAPEDFDWSAAVPDGPLSHGFDYYFGDDVPNFPPYTWIENEHVVTPPTVPLVENPPTAEGSWEARPGPMAAGWRLDAVMPRLTERAVAWIDEHAGSEEPFFLYFPFTSPHAPIVPTDDFEGASDAGGYGDFVVETDWAVGEVLDALDRHGLAENTLVIFTSDNGPERYAYERVRKFNHRSMGPLRGLKRDIWEGGHRVPMIVRWPGHVAAGTTTDGLTSQVDIFATVAAVVGHKLPNNAAPDSFDQSPLWLGDTRESARDAIVHNTFANRYAMRQGDWVLIDAPTGGHSAVPDWYDELAGYAPDEQSAALYNLAEDLSQHRNCIAEFPERAAELRELLSDIREGRGQALDAREAASR